MKKFLIELVMGTPLEPVARWVVKKPKYEFDSSSGYWQRRYSEGGHSGSGSYGRLAEFKARVLNSLVLEYGVSSVIEFGCGDGNQLGLARYDQYIGVDVSEQAVAICREKFENDASKAFFSVAEYHGQSAELALSLDVIYHLVEDQAYQQYMQNLFQAATKYVVIYSSNRDDAQHNAEHVIHRKFSDWVDDNQKEFRLIKTIPNDYPFDGNSPDKTSLADFYVYRKESPAVNR